MDIRALLPEIAERLGAPESEVLRFIERGDLRLGEDAPAGFAPILEADGLTVAGNAQVRYRYLDYAEQLALIREERRAGRGNFFAVVAKLRAMGPEINDKSEMMAPQDAYGYRTVMRPYMGTGLRIREDMCIPFHHFVMQHVLREHLHKSLDVVFEIGSGVGDALAELAAKCPFKHIEFIGGEIALNGQKCLAEFADMLRLPNLRSVDFDITAPNFDFLTGKNALVFSQGALIYIKPFRPEFFKQLVAGAKSLAALLFELNSFEFADEFGITPMFTGAHARRYGTATNLWASVKEAARAGHIVVDEVIPDMCGKNALSAASLIRFHKR